MSDKHNEQQRRYNMQQIKGKNTKPELLLRKILFASGFRYRINVTNLPGKPDMVLKKYKTAIFVNGCFWHGHEHCRFFVIPKTRTDFWINKIEGNKLRDSKNITLLKEMGWSVITVWECELRKDKIQQTTDEIKRIIKLNLFVKR